MSENRRLGMGKIDQDELEIINLVSTFSRYKSLYVR